MRETFHFRNFELDPSGCQLRRNGRQVPLERQPMELLILLVRRHQQLVTRSEIVDLLWGKDVFVGVDTGIHTAVRKIRQALRDRPERPVFVETIPGKGYRFIAPVERAADTTSATRLAVLPFENFTGDPDRDYLANGLTDETIADLGQIDQELQVIGRTTVMGYKQTTKSLAEIGRELRVDFLVESAIRADGDRLRVTSKLIRAADQVQVWSTSLDWPIAGILDLQRELSLAIAGQIRSHLSADRMRGATVRQTRNPEAYDLYLRGRFLENQRTPPANARAIQYYRHAIEVDSTYALAWAGLADTYAVSGINSDAPPSDVWPLAREAATRAVTLQPDLAETQTAAGNVGFWFEWNWPAAETAFRRAIALDAGCIQAHRMVGVICYHTGRHEESERAMRRTVELDPLNAMHRAISSEAAFRRLDYTAALAFARQAIDLDPEFWIGHMMAGQAYEQLGQPDLALESLGTAGRFSRSNSKSVSLRAYVLATTGREDEARQLLDALETSAKHQYVPPYAIGLVHAGLGDTAAMFDWLDRAFLARDVHLVFLSAEPKWDRYRSDARFESLLARCDFSRTRGS
jgi:TolB-like protein/Flp pilus assembly protein TadD